MSKSKKKIVAEFYNSDFFNNPQILKEYLHPEMELFWNAKTGYNHLKRDAIIALAAETAKSYDGVRAEITHLIGKDNQVMIRFTYYVSTIEQPDKEEAIAHFMAIWELKDEKLYKGYQMSQPIESDEDAMKSWI